MHLLGTQSAVGHWEHRRRSAAPPRLAAVIGEDNGQQNERAYISLAEHFRQFAFYLSGGEDEGTSDRRVSVSVRFVATTEWQIYVFM